METKSQIGLTKQEILVGSYKLNNKGKAFNRTKYFEENMQFNKSYELYLKNNNLKDENKEILNNFIERYKAYRNDWTNPIN